MADSIFQKFPQVVLKSLKLDTQSQQHETVIQGQNLLPVLATIYNV
ncbi:MAG: hypothetical protein LBJ00_09235 [Planctomycetaceae bacterium]|nr:hypothetical protein [Planctomycetaceae bacterium]